MSAFEAGQVGSVLQMFGYVVIRLSVTTSGIRRTMCRCWRLHVNRALHADKRSDGGVTRRTAVGTLVNVHK
jgi:hypothetical protein